MPPAESPAGLRATEPGLVAGLPAHNEEARIGRAIRSLTTQELPTGVDWGAIWVVASGCTDRTAEVASASDPRVTVDVELARTGKASALQRLFDRAGPDRLILLNSDAAARRTAVRSLLEEATRHGGPSLVMARAIPPPNSGGLADDVAELLWALHDRFYVYAFEQGRANSVCDELLLVTNGAVRSIPTDVVDDGAYLAQSALARGGRLAYARSAEVEISVPRRWTDHVRQRRRILFGLGQVERATSTPPFTWQRLLTEDPPAAVGLLREAARGHPRPGRALVGLVLGDVLAHVAARIDRVLGRVDHVRWKRVAT